MDELTPRRAARRPRTDHRAVLAPPHHRPGRAPVGRLRQQPPAVSTGRNASQRAALPGPGGRAGRAQLGDHAAVLGASMAGLLTARVLADFYRRVTIIERDRLPQAGLDRKGVPQGRHAHALLPRGAQILGELFPGLLADLAAGGVPVLRSPREFRFVLGGHLLCQDGDRGEPSYAPSRPCLEAQVRDRVRALPNVTIRDQCEVAIFADTWKQGANADGSRVRVHDTV